MRQGVSGGISLRASRATAPPNYAKLIFFGLSAANKFRSEFNVSNFAVLDSIMGKHWDVKPLKKGDPNSFFKYVIKANSYLDSSHCLKFSFSYSVSLCTFCENYREKCKYSSIWSALIC